MPRRLFREHFFELALVAGVLLAGIAGCSQQEGSDVAQPASSIATPESSTTTSTEVVTTTIAAAETTVAETTTTEAEPELLPGQIAFDELDPLPRASAEQLISAISDTEGVWPGFSLADVRTYIAPFNGGDPAWAVVSGFDDPTELGTPTPVQGAPHVFYVVDLINVPEPPSNTIYNPQGEVTGLPGYVLAVDVVDELYFFDPVQGDNYEILIEHEAFHEFQRQFESGVSDQRLRSNYDLSPENIELTFLEDAALVAAVNAPTNEERVAALRSFVAVRDLRKELFESTLLDDGQEWLEGMARWFTFRAGDGAPVYRNPINTVGYTNPGTEGVPPGSGNDGLDDPTTYAETLGGLTFHFTSERFYQTGATQLEILDLLGTTDLLDRVEAGERPSEIARDVVSESGPVDASEVEIARQTYDPDGELAALAEEFSALAIEEASVQR